jgi:hypothetical protein
MVAKYPPLVLKRFCTEPIELVIHAEGYNEDGAPNTAGMYDGKCNYQSKATRVYTEKKTYVQVTGKCLIPGDILPAFNDLSSGEATIQGSKRKVLYGQKWRNPDGTVNYTELDLE